jgi:hypothetical protein
MNFSIEDGIEVCVVSMGEVILVEQDQAGVTCRVITLGRIGLFHVIKEEK